MSCSSWIWFANSAPLGALLQGWTCKLSGLGFRGGFLRALAGVDAAAVYIWLALQGRVTSD